MEQLGPFTSIEQQLSFARHRAQAFPDADPDELAGEPPPAAVATKALKWAGREALQLRAAARSDDLDGFLETFEMFRKRLGAIDYFAMRLRYRWAAAVRKGLEIADIEHRGRKHGSAHMALFEWCREVLFTTWCAACPDKFYSSCQGTPVELDTADVRENWTAVRRLLDAMEFVNPEDLHPQIDAELGALLENAPVVVEASPALPIVRWESEPPEIEYNGKVFVVENDHALAFKAMLEARPDRVGLTMVLGPHPKRKLEQLPSELRALINTNKQGSRLII